MDYRDRDIVGIERAQHLQAMPYERAAQRVDQANGYKPNTMFTCMGGVTCEVPAVTSSGSYSSAFERCGSLEPSVNLALAEMYVQGVSNRKGHRSSVKIWWVLRPAARPNGRLHLLEQM